MDKAVDRLASAVQVRARQVESRLITALTGRTGRAAPLAEGASPDADLLTRWQETTAILESLSSLRDAILRHDAARLKVLHVRPDVVVASPPTRIEDEPGPASNQQPDRRSELQEGGCPVCNHLVEAAFNFYAKWQYKLSVDEPTHPRLCRRIGVLSTAHLAACLACLAAGTQPRLPKAVGTIVRCFVGPL